MFKSTILAVGLVLAPFMAQAAYVSGVFSGTVSSGLDTTGVFGSAFADLSGSGITGAYAYDTAFLSQSVVGTANLATGTGPGALTVTITIAGTSYSFVDGTSSSVYLESSASEFTLQSANNPDANTAESFYLDILDVLNPFILGTEPAQYFSVIAPALSLGTFSINNSGPDVVASGVFSLDSISQQTIPEPASVVLMVMGLVGLSAGYRRGRREPQLAH